MGFVRTYICIVSIFLVVSTSITAQTEAPPPFRVVVLEGDGAINNVRIRSAREPRVRVEDLNGDPLPKVPVTFIVPTLGASGTFGPSGNTVTIITDEEGEATAAGFRPNALVGQFQIRVSASIEGQVARAVIAQTNAAPAQSARGKRIVILGLVAGAVAGGAIAATSLGGGKAAATSPPPSNPSLGISPGTPSFGPPR